MVLCAGTTYNSFWSRYKLPAMERTFQELVETEATTVLDAGRRAWKKTEYQREIAAVFEEAWTSDRDLFGTGPAEPSPALGRKG